ncbi:hypothetical protein [Dactylosporangium sp. NPDC049140]|uniref:hypothetical protein n=1 Tax=Dactylosporangium sp. NPDC049140 TaxID=3155647 RepID=UPI0033F3DF91
MNGTTGPAGRQAAWDAYRAITVGLLPVLYDGSGTDGWAQVNPRLGGVAVRIHRSAPMWDHDGPMLVAAAGSAVRLYQRGDRAALIALALSMAHRLFRLTIATRRAQHPGRHNQHAAWNRRSELGARRPGTPRRNMRQHGQRHHENGVDDD